MLADPRLRRRGGRADHDHRQQPREAAQDIATAIVSAGFTALVDPTMAGRLLVVDALAVVSKPQLAVSTPGFALLGRQTFPRWLTVSGSRSTGATVDIAGNGAMTRIPTSSFRSRLTRGSHGDRRTTRLHGESALASDTRVFCLLPRRSLRSRPGSLDDAVF